jgi:[ribosomal protein S18]-alanine N-acetyltransferase
MMFFRKLVSTFRHHALFARFFGRSEPMLTEAGPRDAAAFAVLHGASFRRGWSEDEFERLLLDRGVLAHRAMLGPRAVGFIISRLAAGEAEILSVAVARAQQGRGLARRLLDLHLRRLAGLGVRTVFLEVDDDNVPARRLYARSAFRQVGRRDGYYPRPGNASATAALVLRRDLG